MILNGLIVSEAESSVAAIIGIICLWLVGGRRKTTQSTVGNRISPVVETTRYFYALHAYNWTLEHNFAQHKVVIYS